MKTECPHCGQHYEVDKEYIDQIVECTSCGQEFVVEIMSGENIPLEEVVQPPPAAAPVDTEYHDTVATFERPEASGGLKALTCEMCGSTDMVKQNGVFVCQSCGTKYSLEEAKRMMIAGTVNVAGTVKVDMSEKLKNLYTIARRAKDEDNSENAAKYYDLVLQEDPESWEASFYLIYYKAMSCTLGEISSAAISVTNCLKSVLQLVNKQTNDDDERNFIFLEITDKITTLTTMLADAACHHFNSIDQQIRDEFIQSHITNLLSIAQICYTLGDLLETQNKSRDLAILMWEFAIDIHAKAIIHCFFRKNELAKVDVYANKIRQVKPNYFLPQILSILTRPSSNPPVKSSSGGCYIATAVYGSYDCPEVWTLRRFRDFRLGVSWYGRLFIKLYYFVSPTIVKYFGQTKIFQTFWRKRLDKFVAKLHAQGVSEKPYTDKNW